MGTLSSAVTAGRRPSLAVMHRKTYLADGWRRVKLWDGFAAATRDAGIVGPDTEPGSWAPQDSSTFASGVGVAGAHLVRYRYMNSKTRYVSEPSASWTWQQADASDGSITYQIGAGAFNLNTPHDAVFTATTLTRPMADPGVPNLVVGDYVTITNAEDAANNGTFGPISAINGGTGQITIPTAGWTANAADSTVTVFRSAKGRITPSTDANVDRIVIEMTLAGGVTYFNAGEFSNSATTATVNVGGALEGSPLEWPDDREDSPILHLLPPVTAHVLYHRGRLFFYGQAIWSTGTVAVTNGSASVVGTGTDWTADALTPTTNGLGRVKRYLRVGSDTVYYPISAQTSSTGLTLDRVYAGGNASGASYSIFTFDDAIYYSEPKFPESVPLEGFVAGTADSPVRALAGVLGGIVIFSDRSVEMVRYTEDPATDGSRRQVSRERGACNNRVVHAIEEQVYSLDRQGVHVFDGAECRGLSRPVQTVIRRINFAVEEKFHAAYLPRLRAIRWWVALDADTSPYHYLQLDLETGAWSMGEREVAVTASALAQTTDGVRCLLGDENGHTWFDDEGTTDGADSSPNARATGTPTTTVVSVDEALPTAGTGLTGVTVHHEALGETRVCSANTASQVTVSSAFSRAPRAGERLQFGRVLSKLRTRAVALGGFPARHTPRHLHLWFQPTTEERHVRVRFFRDYGTAAQTWGDDVRFDDGTRGWTPPQDGPTDTDALVDVSDATGLVRVPVPLEATVVTEAEIEIRESDTPVAIYGIALDAIPTESAV